LPDSGLQHAAHRHFTDITWTNASAAQRSLDGDGTQLGCSNLSKLTRERTDRGTRGGNNYNLTAKCRS
jgi:hypothetical protein